MSRCQLSRVLVPVDGSQGAHDAVSCALAICQAVSGALTVLAVHDASPPDPAAQQPPDGAADTAQERLVGALDRARRTVQSRSLPVTTFLARGCASEVVPAYAREHRQDLIVLSRDDGGTPQSQLAQAAMRIAIEAPCAVIMLR